MATTNRNGQRRKRLQFGNVRYEVCVSPVGEDGMYRATWFCSECKENGEWSPIGSSAAELIGQAEIGVRVHHALYHSGGWQPRKPR